MSLDATYAVVLNGNAAQPWPPPPRAPLPPFPPPLGNYDSVMPVPPPTQPDLYFYRGNFCGIRVPGAPYVNGGPQPGNTDLMMACLLDNYPQEWQEQFLAIYAYKCGYTHLQRSIGHALYYGSSMQSFIALSTLAQQHGLFCDQWLISNEIPGFANDQDANYWAPILGPYIDQLVGAGVMDSCVPSWQMDQVNQGAPGNPTISIIAYVAGKLRGGIPVYTHWINDAMAWWKTGGEVWTDEYQSVNVFDRFSWWQAMAPYLTGGHYQGDVTLARTDPETYQGKIRDTLNNFVNGRMGQSRRLGFSENFRMTNFECTAQDQFNGDCDENEGDKIGYILTCTKADGYVAGLSGYGNGCRYPDGSVV